MEVFFYVFDMIFPVLTGILFLAYFIFYRLWKDKSCFWIGLFFLVQTVTRLTDNVFNFLPSSSPAYEIFAEVWWLLTRILLSVIYYKIIVSKSGIEVPGRESAMLISFGVVIFVLALVPETKNIYFTLLCYILVWGIIRLYPIRKNSKMVFGLFVVVFLMFLIQFTDLILSIVFSINISRCFWLLFALVYFAAAVIDLVQLIKSRSSSDFKEEPRIDPVDLLSAEYGLTLRESEIVGLLLSGYTAKEIADKVFISEGTAKVHIHNIYQKLGINRRAQINVKIDGLLKNR